MKKFITLVAFGIFFGLTIKLFVFEAFTVPTDSMEPTIKAGSKVWLNKLKIGGYKRGEIVGFEHNRENFVKRITGLPNNWVLYNGNFSLVSDETQNTINTFANSSNLISLGEPNALYFKIPKRGDTISINIVNLDFYRPLIENCEKVQAGKLGSKIFVNNKEANSYVFKQNYYFLEGDNKAVSIDSRSFGLISESQIIGEVIGKK